MTLFLGIFTNNVLPAFIIVAVGVLLDRAWKVDKRTLSRLGMYVLTPALVFSGVARSSINPSQFGLMFVFVVALTLSLVGLCLLVGKMLGWSRANTDALVLSVAFMNAGNFGLSVALFTFGDVGLEMATAFFVFSSFAGNTVAGFFAARSNHGSKEALLKAVRLPAPWTFVIALGVRMLELPVPDLLFQPIQLIGRAQMPIMLMLLGIQLSQTRIGRRYKDVAVGVVMRLVVGSLVAMGLAPLVGLEGLARQVAIMQGSTPSAVTSALMAIEFDADAEYVTSVIFITTLLSSITLTIVIGLLI